MQIMCLNGWGGTLYSDLLPYLSQAVPDVLCLQEVVHTPESDKDWLTYRDGDHVLPQRANFFRDVCAALPEHVAAFCPAAQGVLWDEEQSISSQWGLATFVHRSFPIVGQVQRFVHKGYAAKSYGDHPRSRSAHGIRVYDYTTDRAVSITHMHGLRDLNGKKDTPERFEQAKRLLNISQSVSEPGDLRVVCGDFNVEPGSETIRLLEDDGFVELVNHYGIETTRNSHYKKPGKFADYMLIDRVDEIMDFQVLQKPEVSDHCPLVLTLKTDAQKDQLRKDSVQVLLA
ncbi:MULTISPECIES: endonuclease/exonuclease/phosphatase family protein [unclassified Pseudovibrio]|uniref:endonuclease/exonuclease/phosphatase family protein n=1 Tax=unclassified Pseudovibrio TaxID=2627060 RepID=UPI0007AE8B01|nr:MULTISPECIES: endonuclease/exonuclease/phosphatase family protein [unclassified Pseudovibrio]